MSRVFEALRRAESERTGTNGKKESVPWILGDDASFERPSRLATPPGLEVASVTQPLIESKRKSLKERLEEFLFGWSLKRCRRYPIVAWERESPAAEQYKILREQVKKLCRGARIRSLSVCSPTRMDGKTMVAVNLAAALALDYEEQVLLIDGDLRSPGVHLYFGLDRSPGLSDYLSATSRGDLTSYVRQTSFPGLSILPAGRVCGHPSELLARDKMSNLMEEVRSLFPKHMTIVDTPAILSTADPILLAEQVQGIIMVMRAGKTPRVYLSTAIQTLNSDKVMGIVLNGAELGPSAKYYYHYSPKTN